MYHMFLYMYNKLQLIFTNYNVYIIFIFTSLSLPLRLSLSLSPPLSLSPSLPPSLPLPPSLSSLPYLCTSILTDSAPLSADGLRYPLGGFSRYTTGYQNLTSAPSLGT